MIVVLLIVAGVVARIAAVAKRGDARTVQMSGKRARNAPPQTMTELLEEMRNQLENGRRKAQVKAPAALPLPVAKSSRTRTAMVQRVQRTEPVEVVSVRPPPVEVDYDAEAERLVASRIAAAMETAKGRRPDEHAAFDQRIRAAGVAATATSPSRRSRLRTAVIWQEILGPPVSLRTPDE